jgi:hypothetical protein
MRALVTGLVLAAISVQGINAELSVKQYKEIMASGNESRIQMTRAYVLGLGEGMRNLNATLLALSEVRVFCPPAKLALGVEKFYGHLR